MIGKQIKGASFRGVLNYMEAKVNDGVGKFIDSNMMNDNARNLANEFGIIRSLKPNIKKAVYHCSLAIGKDEKLTDEQFKKLGQDYLKEMGFDNSQYVMYRHFDRDHPHIHLIANRIDMDGKVVSDGRDYRRSEETIRELEKKYSLSPVLESKFSKESSLSKGQIELYRRTGTIPAKKQIQIVLRKSLTKAISVAEFEKNLAEYGVLVKHHKNNQGKVFGVSFELNGQAFKGSALGKGYSWTNINNQIHLNHERNRGSSQEIHRGETANLDRTSRKPSENQRRQYSGIERGLETNSGKLSKTNYGPEAGVNEPSGTTDKSYHRYSNDGTAKNFPGQENIGFEKNEIPTEYQGNGIGPGNRIGLGDRNLFNPFLSSNSLKDEDEELPRKKKKKKRKGKNPGIGM
ncbi:relaxase/mobilization nuclease domain-containing protein [Marinilabilia salmonicolor]|uniref:relaxase/mobilization nuclease domain-containing protein n=1 Tax=Marinilabilia salmonicolor TaxID=989 RepID=UPI00029A559F|nr:relaxase/mobilization nuclease domain-containing protein [Marinilabilia salmonicolor]